MRLIQLVCPNSPHGGVYRAVKGGRTTKTFQTLTLNLLKVAERLKSSKHLL